MKRPIFKPVYNPPVWCHDNSDGTFSWPGSWAGERIWTKIHNLNEIPLAYQKPRVIEVSSSRG